MYQRSRLLLAEGYFLSYVGNLGIKKKDPLHTTGYVVIVADHVPQFMMVVHLSSFVQQENTTSLKSTVRVYFVERSNMFNNNKY